MNTVASRQSDMHLGLQVHFYYVLLQLNLVDVHCTLGVAILCYFIFLTLKFAVLFMRFDNFD